MMRHFFYTISCLVISVLIWSCAEKKQEAQGKVVLEVGGQYLYEDELHKILPPNVSDSDSIDITQSYIRKWVVGVLMYQNAKRNITNQAEIDELVESYRKSLTIHQYQQKLIEQRLPKEPADEDLQAFYKEYSDQLVLNECVLQGLLLVVPKSAPQLANVRSWVQAGNTKALENIEKYSIRNAISYDYFGDRWVPFADVLKKMPLQVTDPAGFLSSRRFVECADSTQHYFLKISSFRKPGQTEPYEMAKNRISAILINKQKADFMTKFEDELYNDAIKDKSIRFYKK
ncbi:MAG: hypothetical protein RIS29_480 [Bacteroidota bacterium]|jgi:hypothetical protein